MYLKFRTNSPSTEPDSGYGAQSPQYGRDISSENALFCQDCHYDTEMYPLAEGQSAESVASSFCTDLDNRCVKGRVAFRIGLSHGFRAGGWLSGKSKNSLNATGSYISQRKIPGQELLGAKCLCCDVFAQHRARGCLRSHPRLPAPAAERRVIVVFRFLFSSCLRLVSLFFFFPLLLLFWAAKSLQLDGEVFSQPCQ